MAIVEVHRATLLLIRLSSQEVYSDEIRGSICAIA